MDKDSANEGDYSVLKALGKGKAKGSKPAPEVEPMAPKAAEPRSFTEIPIKELEEMQRRWLWENTFSEY